MGGRSSSSHFREWVAAVCGLGSGGDDDMPVLVINSPGIGFFHLQLRDQFCVGAHLPNVLQQHPTKAQAGSTYHSASGQ